LCQFYWRTCFIYCRSSIVRNPTQVTSLMTCAYLTNLHTFLCWLVDNLCRTFWCKPRISTANGLKFIIVQKFMRFFWNTLYRCCVWRTDRTSLCLYCGQCYLRRQTLKRAPWPICATWWETVWLSVCSKYTQAAARLARTCRFLMTSSARSDAASWNRVYQIVITSSLNDVLRRRRVLWQSCRYVFQVLGRLRRRRWLLCSQMPRYDYMIAVFPALCRQSLIWMVE